MSSRRIRFAILGVFFLLSLGIASFAVAASQSNGKGNGKGDDDGKRDRSQFTAKLSGHEEVPATHSQGTGRLKLTINDDNTMSFELTYSGLANPATVAHVHFGQFGANGGVVFFFCGGSTKPTPCPPGQTTPATVTGTIVASDIVAIGPQLIPLGDAGLAAVVEEIKEGFAYANVHTGVSLGGEIRGQLDGRGGRDHDDDDD
jgi:hypothetical protein